MKTLTTLVTGASGFVGGRLIQPGDRAFVRRPSGLPNEMIGDLLDPESVKRACDGVNRVFHCAGFVHAMQSSSNDCRHNAINFKATRDLVWAAGRAGVRTFVFLSSVKAMQSSSDECVDEVGDGTPATAYGNAKRKAEAEVVAAGRSFGMQVVNLRLAMVYGRGGRGNLYRMARGIKSGWFPPIPETGNKRSLVHVDDVVAAVRHVAEEPAADGKTYIVAHYHAPSGREIYDAIRHCFGRKRISWEVPSELFRLAGQLGDVCPPQIGLGKVVNSQMVSSLLDTECYSPTRIDQELKWRAVVGFEAGLNEMICDQKDF